MEKVYRLIAGIDVHKEDAGGSGSQAIQRTHRIPAAEVRHDARGDPAFGRLAAVTLVRKFKRILKDFGRLGLDVRALLD
jgi:hypothetical protein